jgi:hypothetical protein
MPVLTPLIQQHYNPLAVFVEPSPQMFASTLYVAEELVK